PYEYSIKTNEPIIIRQGEEKTIGGKILTDKEMQMQNVKIFNIFNPNNNNNIKLKLHNSHNETYNPNTPLPIAINVPETIPIGEYTLNLFANATKKISIPEAFLMGALGNFHFNCPTMEIVKDGKKIMVFPSLSKIANFVGTAATFNETFSMPINLDLSVIKQYSGEEIFSQFWDTYGDPISLIAGGFAAGFSALIFDRIKNKAHNKNKKLDDYY
ncbi:MAG: hypothetical protein ACRD6U_02090, partial [Nitrososphaeraceae archaeon]